MHLSVFLMMSLLLNSACRTLLLQLPLVNESASMDAAVISKK